jgi:CDP-diglyceride synthetase
VIAALAAAALAWWRENLHVETIAAWTRRGVDLAMHPGNMIAWPSVAKAALLGGVLALIGQAGDLMESLIKRDVGAKDSARMVPAFGGLLDMLDSPLVGVPVAYLVLLQW